MGRQGPGHAMRVGAMCLAVFSGSTAWALPIVNGDFSDATALSGYTASGSVISEPGGQFAQLDTDGTFTRTLSQHFSIPVIGSSFSFDFAFSTEGIPPFGGLADSLAVSIQTLAGDLLDILVVDALGAVADPSDGIETVTGATPITVSLDPSVGIAGFAPLSGVGFAGRVSLRLPNVVLGQDATLFVDLFDQGDGFASRGAVDNFSVTTLAVPEPSALALIVLGLAGGMGAARRRT